MNALKKLGPWTAEWFDYRIPLRPKSTLLLKRQSLGFQGWEKCDNGIIQIVQLTWLLGKICQYKNRANKQATPQAILSLGDFNPVETKTAKD